MSTTFTYKGEDFFTGSLISPSPTLFVRRDTEAIPFAPVLVNGCVPLTSDLPR